MREYTDDKYIELIENTSDHVLQQHMQYELDEIVQTKNSSEKTFIDLGAGHGRILPTLANISKNVISIELNQKMLPELKKRTRQFDNAKVIVGDITTLSVILKEEDITHPVLLLLQNTLGTIEGDWQNVLSEMKKVAKDHHGEIIISFFRAEALPTWGISALYPSVSKMVGNPDLDKTDFRQGIFVSHTGYRSKWRSKAEIEKIKDFFQGKLLNEVWTDQFCILHFQL